MEAGGSDIKDGQVQSDTAAGDVLEAKESLDEKIAHMKCVDFFTEWKKCICKCIALLSSIVSV